MPRIPTHLLLTASIVLALVAAPASATASTGDAPLDEDTIASDKAFEAAPPAACSDLAPLGLQDPIPMAPCTVSVVCADGTTISCNGNSSCSTSGSNDRCVTCDGVQEACCAKTCCENCEDNLNDCLNNCGNPFPRCNICYNAYNYCVSEACGGCP